MMKNLKIFFRLILISIIFTTCKKYSEGPALFSFHTVLNRLAGTYVLEKYIVNGMDSTDIIPPCYQANSLAYTTSDGRYYFKFDRHGNISGIDGAGNYILQDPKKKIGIGYYNNPSLNKNVLNPVFYPGIWEIRKLTTNEFWIKEVSGNLTFEVHLKKIHKL